MAEKLTCIATYRNHTEAEQAVQDLQESGFDMKNLSILGKDHLTEEHVVGYYTAGDRMKYWGNLGAFWGWLWGTLFGWAFFWVPGIGPILAAGPLVSIIVAGLEGATLTAGLSALGAGLYSIGIPRDSVIKYETALKSDRYLLIAHGTADEVKLARDILGQSNAAEVVAHTA